MKTLTTLASILILSVINPVVADEVIGTQFNSIELSELALSLTADLNAAQIQIGYDIEDEIANLDRINQVSKTYIKHEHLNHIQHLNLNSNIFSHKNLRVFAAD